MDRHWHCFWNRRRKLPIGLCVSAFGAGIVVAFIFPGGIMVFLLGLILIGLGCLLINKK